MHKTTFYAWSGCWILFNMYFVLRCDNIRRTEAQLVRGLKLSKGPSLNTNLASKVYADKGGAQTNVRKLLQLQQELDTDTGKKEGTRKAMQIRCRAPRRRTKWSDASVSRLGAAPLCTITQSVIE